MIAGTAWWRRSIGARVIALFLGLLLAIQVVSFTALRGSLTEHARHELPARVAEGERLLQTLLDRRVQTLLGGARVLASDYGFRAALASNDNQTIVSVLSNHGARIGATVSALLGADFTLRSSTSSTPQAIVPLIQRLVAQAAAEGAGDAIALVDGHPIQAVLVPVKAPRTIGWVLMGFPLDAQLAVDLHGLSGLDMTLLQRRSVDDPWRATGTSADGALAAGLGAIAPRQAAPATSRTTSVVDGEEYIVAVVPLDNTRAAGGVDGVLGLLSLSVDAAVKLPLDLQWALVLVNFVGMIVFALGSVVMTRRVTAPLRSLASSAERLGAGDYATPVTERQREDEIGELAHSFERMRVNVAEHREQILRLAYQDGLTGLANRTRFRDAIHEALSERLPPSQIVDGTHPLGARALLRDRPIPALTTTRRPLAVLMIDLDRFKRVNDVLGYEVGDRLLVDIARRLEQCAGGAGRLLARLGGDEFGLLVPGADAAQATDLAHRVAEAVDAPFQVDEHRIDMGAGIGIACWPEHATDADSLLVRAEMAVVAAKRKSIGPQLYDPALDVTSAQSLTLMTELRRAVERGELRLYLQPKLALADRRVIGAEALVRWVHPTRGLVPPMQFIPFAEQSGFIRTLTQWVFEESARQWKVISEESSDFVLSVNLSTRDLTDPELPAKFAAALKRHRVPPSALCLEITESAIMDDPQRALATLDTLAGMGFKLSIDDFGTGYSSLAYLKRLPVDELKIDQSFVRHMQADNDDATIVRSTIDLAHNLGLTVVAEGVENEASWTMLRDLNCNHAQGYHMARPMPAGDFSRWMLAAAVAPLGRESEGTSLLH